MKTFREFISEALAARVAAAALRQLTRNRGTVQRVTQNIANQGIQPTKKLLSFRTAYHGTSSGSAKNIRKAGFKSGTESSKNYHMPPEAKPYWAPERVFATTNKDVADKYAKQASSKRTAVQQIFDRISGKGKSTPETMKLAVTNRSDIRPALRDGEFTIPTQTADTALRNAEALRKINQGKIRVKRTNGNNFEIA